MWIPEIELRFPGLATSNFTHGVSFADLEYVHDLLNSPWKVTGILVSTSALATSLKSLAFRIRRYAGFCPAPGLTTTLRTTPVN